jgi:TM2 domain-containing membrane protein YozV
MLIRLYQSLFKLLAEICAWVALAMPALLFLCSILVLCIGEIELKVRILVVLSSFLILVTVFLLEVLIIAPIMVLFTLDSRLKTIDAMLNGEPVNAEKITHENTPEPGNGNTDSEFNSEKVVNRNTYAILSLLFGALGIQHFYAGKPGKGLLCLVFCWTYIPFIAGLISGILAFQKKSDQNGNIIIK